MTITETGNCIETKDQMQLRIVNTWVEKGYRGTFIAVTGVGKTRTAIRAIERYRNLHPNASVIITVPTLYLQSQWELELKKFHVEFNTRVLVNNTASTHKYVCDLLICDEVHTLGAEGFFEVFNTIRYNALFCITATLERSDNRHQFILAKSPIIATVGLNEAIRNKWVSEFEIYNLPVPFTDKEKEKYDSNQRLFNYNQSLLGGKFDAWNTCEEWKNSEDPEERKIAYRFMACMKVRTGLIYNAENKIRVTEQIIQNFPQSRAIVFCQSIKFAQAINKKIGKNSIIYHSGLTTQEKRAELQKFIDGEARVISSVKSMDAGVDIPGLDLGIIASGSSKELQNTQRGGRVIRKEPGKQARIINLYVPDTQEVNWLKTRLQKVEGRVNWINNLTEIL